MDLATGDIDRVWAFWTRAAEQTLLTLSCPDVTPDTPPVGAALPLAPRHLPRGKGTDRLLLEPHRCLKQRRGTEEPLTCPLARIRLSLGDRFLMDYYPGPRGGSATLAVRYEAPTGATLERAARGPAAQSPPGRAHWHPSALCMEHGGPSCARCKSLGWGISRCYRVAHEGQCGPMAGP